MVSTTFITAAIIIVINFTLELTTSIIAVGLITTLNLEQIASTITVIDNKLMQMFTNDRINEILKNNS